MTFLMGILFLTFSTWIVPPIVYAATYFVAKSGSNSYSCTQAQSVSTPRTTIASGIACLRPGDTLIIKGGTYAEGIERGTIPSGISRTAPTTIKSATSETVIISGSNSLGDALSIYDRSYIVLDGLIFDGYRVRIGGNGPAYSHHITVQNSTIRNSYKARYPSGSQSCATSQGPAGANSHINYINNDVYNCGPDSGHGIYVNSRDSLLENNRIHNNAGMGIHQYQSRATTRSNNNIFRNNRIYSNGSAGILIGTGANNLAYGNIVSNNGRKNTAGGIRIGHNSPDGNHIYHNTIYSNTGVCINIDSSSVTSKIKNNFCLRNTSNVINDLGRQTTKTKNRMSTDVSLVTDASNNRFEPRSGSALIDAGESIAGFTSRPFSGAAPDQGALEFAPNTPPQITVPSAPRSLVVAP